MSQNAEQLAAALSGGSSDVRSQAAEQLSQMGAQAAPAAVALVRACGDTDAVRELAVAALEDLGPPPAKALGELAILVADSHEDVAYWAATLIGRLGGQAASTVGVLAKALNDSKSLAVRQRAAWALGQIGAPASAALPALSQAAGAADARLSRLAQQAVDQIRGAS